MRLLRRAGIFALALGSAIAMSSCSTNESDSNSGHTTTVTASPETTAERSETKDSETSQPSASEEVKASTTPSPGGAQQSNPTGEVVIGHTEAPGQANPSVMNKTIASCGDPTMHETGTTFFTDGTSGWTLTCANKMVAARPAEPAPAPDDSYYEGYLDGYDDGQYYGDYNEYEDYDEY